MEVTFCLRTEICDTYESGFMYIVNFTARWRY